MPRVTITFTGLMIMEPVPGSNTQKFHVLRSDDPHHPIPPYNFESVAFKDGMLIRDLDISGLARGCN